MKTEKVCPHCKSAMLDDGDNYIYCRKSECGWVEWKKMEAIK